MRDSARALGKSLDIIPALGKSSVFLPARAPSPLEQPHSGGGGRDAQGQRALVIPVSPPGPSELSGSARGAVPGEGPGAAPQAPRAGRGLQSPAPPSRRLRARLPARGAAMGAAPCGAAPASPRPFRPREPARDRGTAGVPPPAAGLALLGGRGPDEVSCAALRIIPNSGFCRTSLWTRYIHKKTSNI